MPHFQSRHRHHHKQIHHCQTHHCSQVSPEHWLFRNRNLRIMRLQRLQQLPKSLHQGRRDFSKKIRPMLRKLIFQTPGADSDQIFYCSSAGISISFSQIQSASKPTAACTKMVPIPASLPPCISAIGLSPII